MRQTPRVKKGRITRRLQRGGAVPNDRLAAWGWPLASGQSVGSNQTNWSSPKSGTPTPTSITITYHVGTMIQWGAGSPVASTSTVVLNGVNYTPIQGTNITVTTNTWVPWKISNLTPGTQYTLTELRLKNADGTTLLNQYSTADNITPPVALNVVIRTLPLPVTNLAVSDITSTGFKLSWKGGEGNTGFYVVYTQAAGSSVTAVTATATPVAVNWFGSSIQGDPVNGYTATATGTVFAGTTMSLGLVPINYAGNGTTIQTSLMDSAPVINPILIKFPPPIPVITATTVGEYRLQSNLPISTTDNTVTITYSGTPALPAPTTSITYKYSDSITGNQLTPITSNSSTATFKLEFAKTYSIIVTITNLQGSSSSAPMIVKTQPIKPPVTVSNITASGFTLNWPSDYIVDNYRFSIYKQTVINSVSAETIIPISSTATSATFDGFGGPDVAGSLTPSYWFKGYAPGQIPQSSRYFRGVSMIVSNTNNGINTPESWNGPSVIWAAPDPITLSGNPTITSTSYSFSWKSFGASALNTTVRIDGLNVTPTTVTSVNTAGATNWNTLYTFTTTITGLSAGTRYTGTIDAGNKDNTAKTSSTITFLTRPGPITGESFSSNAEKSVTLRWSPPKGVESYTYTMSQIIRVEYNNFGSPYDFVNSVLSGRYGMPPNRGAFIQANLTVGTFISTESARTPDSSTENTATFTNLSPNIAYIFSVTAINPSGSATPVYFVASTPPPAPTIGTPTITSATGVTSNSFTVLVTATGSTASFSYTIDDNPVTPVETVTRSATQSAFLNSSQRYSGLATVVTSNAAFSGIAPGTHTLVIMANGSVGTGSPTSYVITFAPDKPVLSSTNVKYNEFTITWTAGTGATSYSYTIGGAAATPKSTGTNSATFDAPNASTTYSVTVTATNSAGSSPASNALPVTTAIAPPSPATELSFTNITGSGFTVSWTAGARAASYTYNVNGAVATPAATGSSSATFTGLSNEQPIPVIINSVNISGITPSDPATVTLLNPQQVSSALQQEDSSAQVQTVSSSVQQQDSSARQQGASSALQQQASSSVQQAASSSVQQQDSSAQVQQSSSATQQGASSALQQKASSAYQVFASSAQAKRARASGASTQKEALVIQLEDLRSNMQELIKLIKRRKPTYPVTTSSYQVIPDAATAASEAAKAYQAFAAVMKQILVINLLILDANPGYEDPLMQTLVPDAKLAAIGHTKKYDALHGKYIYYNSSGAVVANPFPAPAV